MAFTVLKELELSGDTVNYDPAFREQLESHLNILRFTNPEKLQITDRDLWQYQGNFYGLLAARGISADQHWIILRMNGFHNPNEFGRKPPELALPNATTVIYRPDQSLLESIRTLFLDKNKT